MSSMLERKSYGEKSQEEWNQAAKKHLWMHFSHHAQYFGEHPADIEIVVSGKGHHVYTMNGRKLIDGISGLFTVQVGHGRKELAEAASNQMGELAYFPLWSYAHTPAIMLAERLAKYAPGDLNRVSFTTGGGEGVESAWKIAKQYFKLRGFNQKVKVISRQFSYHGTTHGALAITGVHAIRGPFSPLVPGAIKVPNTCQYRAPEHLRDDPAAFGLWAANRIEEAIEFEGPDQVCAVFLEPLQNSGGCFPPPPGYWQKVREICTRHNVLLVADETITAFGRLGEIFGVTRYGAVPDMIVCAKGMTSGYAPIGALIVSDKIFEPFKTQGNFLPHGFTFGGHPASCAVALANLDIIENERLLENVRANQDYFRSQLETLLELDIVGDVRGDGYFYGIEMVKEKSSRMIFSDEESEKLIRGFLSPELFRNGLYCRADDRGEPVIQVAPPLTINRDDIDEIVNILRTTLVAAEGFLQVLYANGSAAPVV